MTKKELSSFTTSTGKSRNGNVGLNSLRNWPPADILHHEYAKRDGLDRQDREICSRDCRSERASGFDILKCFYELNRLNRYIESVTDSQMRIILSLRYVNGLNWVHIAMSLGGGNTPDGERKAHDQFLQDENIENV
jgi:hypothetical protein